MSDRRNYFGACKDNIQSFGEMLIKDFGKHMDMSEHVDNEDSRSGISSNIDKSISEYICKTLATSFFSHFNGETLMIITEEDMGALIYENSVANMRHAINVQEIEAWESATLVIDPICGSIPYARGIADFNISIGFVENHEIVFGLVLDPVRKELFSAYKGEGAFCNERLIKPSNVKHEEKAYISIEHKVFRKHFNEELHILIKKMMRLRVAGTCGLELCYVASGRSDACIKLSQALYDYCGGLIILLETHEAKIWDGKKHMDYKVVFNETRDMYITNGKITGTFSNFAESIIQLI